MQAPRVEGRKGASIFSVRLFPASEKNGKIIRYLLVVVQAEVSDRRPANAFTISEVSDPVASCCYTRDPLYVCHKYWRRLVKNITVRPKYLGGQRVAITDKIRSEERRVGK